MSDLFSDIVFFLSLTLILRRDDPRAQQTLCKVGNGDFLSDDNNDNDDDNNDDDDAKEHHNEEDHNKDNHDQEDHNEDKHFYILIFCISAFICSL